MKSEIKLILFDWGDTLMRDYKNNEGPMCFWENVLVIEGVVNFLKHASPNYKMAVATNAGCSDTALMTQALKRGGIETCFSSFFSSIDLGVSKPDPLFFTKIANALGLNTAQIAMIGNDYNKDIIPAKSVGMHTYFFNESNLIDSFIEADHVFTHFDQLHGLF